MRNFGGFAKAFEAAIDKTLGIDGAQAEAVLGKFAHGSLQTTRPLKSVNSRAESASSSAYSTRIAPSWSR